MNKQIEISTTKLVLVIGLSMLALWLGIKPGMAEPPSDTANRANQQTLLVWAGDQQHNAPDFVAVVTAVTHIPDYNGTAINGRPHGFAIIGNGHHDQD